MRVPLLGRHGTNLAVFVHARLRRLVLDATTRPKVGMNFNSPFLRRPFLNPSTLNT